MKRYTAPVIVLLAIAVAGVYIKTSMASSKYQVNSEGHLIFTNEQNVAIGGFDVVNYFTDGKAVVGTSVHETRHNGAIWRFASAQNQRLFEQAPQKYMPQFGGFCAWGLAEKNKLFPVDPNRWSIVDGKLYLNFNEDVQQKWLAGQGHFIKAADKLWPGLKSEHRAK